jgi:hypothetical protein
MPNFIIASQGPKAIAEWMGNWKNYIEQEHDKSLAE